jgi:hypothetical protein
MNMEYVSETCFRFLEHITNHLHLLSSKIKQFQESVLAATTS